MLDASYQSACSGHTYEVNRGVNRRQFLQGSGLLGMGGIIHVCGRSPHTILSHPAPILATTSPASVNHPPSGLQWRTLSQPAVTVDARGTVIQATPVTVQVFEEPLGCDPLGNAVTLTMVKIPAGEARIGSRPSEMGRFDHEKQPCIVPMPSFFMGMTPITQQVYATVMGTHLSSDWGRRHGLQADKPVVGIGWKEAIAFCHALSYRTGNAYRLPTEIEWEYACRAGTQTPFHCGPTLTGAIANYNSAIAYDAEPVGPPRDTLTPVGQFSPNAFGLFDLHGNVWEWCFQSCSDQPHSEQPYAGQPVLRGGAWNSYPWVCRSATRLNRRSGEASQTLGLRVIGLIN